MKNSGIQGWVELKRQTPYMETILTCRRITRKTTPWKDMALFFKEADKHIK